MALCPFSQKYYISFKTLTTRTTLFLADVQNVQMLFMCSALIHFNFISLGSLQEGGSRFCLVPLSFESATAIDENDPDIAGFFLGPEHTSV